MDLEDIMQTDINQTEEKQILPNFTYTWNLKKKQQQMNKHKGNRVIDTEKQQVWDGRKKKK